MKFWKVGRAGAPAAAQDNVPPPPAAAAALVMAQCGEGVLIADLRARGQPIVAVNAAFEKITGYSAAEAIGKNCRYLQGSDRLQPEIDEIRGALADGRACSVTLRNYRRDGTMFRNALRLVPLRDDAGDITHFVGLIRDVSQSAGVDRLTGLLDRYGLLDRLAAANGPTTRVLLMVKLDITRFHDVNNGFGYEVGDALLCAVAGRLGTLPATAVARVGTNSFALAFELDDSERAAAVVEDILELLKTALCPPWRVRRGPVCRRLCHGASRRRPAHTRSAGRRSATAIQNEARARAACLRGYR